MSGWYAKIFLDVEWLYEKEYKKYITENFKLFNPFTDKDPNITYEEYLKKCEDIDSVNKFTTKLRKDNNTKLVYEYKKWIKKNNEWFFKTK